MWLVWVLDEYYRPLVKDFAKMGYSLELIGEDGPRSLSIMEAYLLIKDEFCLPGHWLHAEYTNSIMPITYQEDVALQASLAAYSYFTAKFDKRGKPAKLNTGVFKDKQKERAKARKELLSTLTAEEKAQLDMFNNDENAFAGRTYTTKKPHKLGGGS